MLKRTWKRKIRSGVGSSGPGEIKEEGGRRSRRVEGYGRGRPTGVRKLWPLIDLDLMDVSDDVA